jgi:hypothetical protein
MLVDGGRRLRTTVAIKAAEIESVDAMLAERARECSPAVHRFGPVISHSFIVVLLLRKDLVQQVRDLGAGLPFWESELNRPIADAAPSLSRKRQLLLLSCQLNKDGLPTFHTVPGLGDTTGTRPAFQS